ncbi:GntR family transcriptional regulator [Rhodococcoides trifolii]|uniref:GntR family transcriptional regulator n=1 Tax=Rhodococcoides trifolii TaxID=908250 RepID=A0A917CL11_9NOCA|nr:GntR family transcriptional regulator [Rhodococcus trifolii]GGF92127.1 GntR family transcriptional regulator [Rhodococcus trifolii]
MAFPDSRADDSPGAMVASGLREKILARELVPGERLIEESIAKRFGVSRVPVREALAQLESEGFVTIVRYRGATVSESLAKDSHELLQVRRGLEVLAAQLAAENRGGDAADELSAIARGQATDSPFHDLVAVASGNGHLREMVASINRRLSWGFGQNPEASFDDHAVLARAILGGAQVQAAFLMAEHLSRDEQYFADKWDTD